MGIEHMAKKREKGAGGRKVRELSLGRDTVLRLVTERGESALKATLELHRPEGKPVVILEGNGRREDEGWALTLSLSEKEVWKLLLEFLNRLGKEEE